MEQLKQTLNIKDAETPKFKKEKVQPQTPIHIEIHGKQYIEVDKKAIELTRKEILEKYNVFKEHCFILPIPEGTQFQRVVRCFVLIKERERGIETYYNYIEGSVDHAILIRHFLKSKKFSEEEINNNNLWEIKKGIIDPFGKNFENYPQVKKELREQKKETNWVLTFEHTPKLK